MTEHDEFDETDDWGVPVGAYQDPDSLAGQMWSLARAYLVYRCKPAVVSQYHALRRRNWSPRRLFTLANALVLLWGAVLYWGERAVFDGAVGRCSWDGWENWEPGANPHRVIFVADPQLVDPHTYPGRPWPLNPITIQYTDRYMRRAYSRLHTALDPDTVLFLGDLFDGGREWSTPTTHSPEKQYQRYGDDYWLREYNRFGNIFLNHWRDDATQPRPGQPGRKIISSLPGNHDLGFARGVQVGVRNRFNAFFGDGNRIDILGNHTFVSIDSVSLSALGEDSPQEVEELWRPTKTFLENAKAQKHRLVQRELRIQKGLKPYPGYAHTVIEAEGLPTAQLPHFTDDVQDFPTVLLTHVPLYRAPGTPCGPQRERYPPSPGNPDNDDRNAIAVRGGYQYQNVLNRDITADIAEKVGDIRYAFSGDDHDYCELVHRGYASAGGGIREITVKSVSLAMGVRLPGVVLASLWNPVDGDGKPMSGDASKTIQTQLCLLPDQLGIFIQYGLLFGLTLVLLAMRAALITFGLLSSTATATTTTIKPTPLLPTSKTPLDKHHDTHDPRHSSNSSISSEHTGNLQSRNTRTSTRTSSPTHTLYTLPSHPHHHYQTQYTYPVVPDMAYPDADEKHVKIYGYNKTRDVRGAREAKNKKVVVRKGVALFWYEFKSSLGVVCLAGFAWYAFLIFRG